MKPITTYILLLIFPLSLFAQKREGSSILSAKSFNGRATIQSEIKVDSGLNCYLGLPYVHHKTIYQDVFIQGKTEVASVTITNYDVTDPQDTIKVFSIRDKSHKLRKRNRGIAAIHLTPDNKSLYFHSLYHKILVNNNSLPAGNYHVVLALRFKDHEVEKTFNYHIDSLLNVSSSTGNDLDRILSTHNDKSFLGVSYTTGKNQSRQSNTSHVLKKSSRKINSALKAKGFTVNYREAGDNTFADIFCKDRFVGTYRIDMNEPIAEKIESRKKRLKNNLASGVNTGIDRDKPVFSQMKELKTEKAAKETREAKGNISVTGNAASGQEENSQNENNYYELAGQLDVPIMNIPVHLEGYYTSQDRARTSKASFFRLHYDSEQAKSELLQLISGYKSKYNETSSKEASFKGIYGTLLGKLRREKGLMLTELVKETGISDIEKYKADTAALREKITSAYEKKLTDSLDKYEGATSGISETQQAAAAKYASTVEKFRKIEELEGRITHYEQLLEQYSNSKDLDSMIAYEKVKDIDYETASEMSYKQLSKSAGSLLPPGDRKKFISGLTTLDLGIFTKEISEYTLNGQNIKGLDVGYDVGKFETGFTYGNVEYVSRDGVLDRYNGYSGRVSFKPAKRQKTAIIYYGYSPGRKMLNTDTFFRNVDVTMPSFKTPINVVAITHSGAITRNVNVDAEVATSFRNAGDFEKSETGLVDKMAYRINAEGHIPLAEIDVRACYEHIGKQFENNTLPLTLSGTEKYNAAASGQFLKDFLTLGIEYNYLVQHNFASKSGSSKWGFEVKTSSKRYPSVSLSYKPFTTFRSFSDTFNIPQRPILGEVWLGKLSYQIKNKVSVLRLTAVYNRNTALIDTMESNSNIAQLNAIYSRGKIQLMANAGQTSLDANNISPVHVKTKFLTIGAGYALDEQWNVTAGQDIGMIKSRLSRYGANFGLGFRFKKLPLALRCNFRYNTYKMNEAQAWKNIYAGMLDVNWQFRFKVKDKV